MYIVRATKKTRSLLCTFLLLLAIIYPSTPCVTSTSLAATLTSRSIVLSNSAASATGVNYLVQFTTPSNIQSIIIEFCGDSPVIGTACDQTASTTTGLPSFAAASATFTNVSGLTNWSYVASQWRLRFTKNTGSTVGAGSTVSFVIGNVANMHVARSFYARIYTYADTGYGGSSPYVSATNPGNYADGGGFALSTTTSFTISARVMESLIFCVSGSAPSASCSGTSPPNVNLGHGSASILDSSQVDSATVYAQISTNAQSGAILSLKSGASCAGLSNDSGNSCPITAQNNGSSPAVLVAGSGQFGVGVTGASGLNAVTKYDGSGGKSNYDPSTSTGVRSAYGDIVASSSTPLDNTTASLKFSASASTTTPAGVYTTAISVTATGTY